MRISVVTVSDSSYEGTRVDRSGPVLVQLIRESKKIQDSSPTVSDPLVIPDDKDLIAKTLIDLCQNSDVIITSGGTGWAPRDVTPEATESVIEKRCGGLETAIHMRSLQATPMAALSRLTVGIRGSTLVVNFPGSPKAVKECWEVLEGTLTHGVSLILGEDQSKVHEKVQASGSH